jgi:hypothetical protein
MKTNGRQLNLAWQESGLTVMYTPDFDMIFSNYYGKVEHFNNVTVRPRTLDYIHQLELKINVLGCETVIQAYPGDNFYLIETGDNLEIACLCDKLIFNRIGLADMSVIKNERYIGGITIHELDLSHAEFRPFTETTGRISAMGCFNSISVDKLILGKFDTYKVEVMDYMFYGSSIGNINEILEKLDTSNAKSMAKMFRFSSGNELDISKLDTSKVESMNAMFSHCNYKKLNISNIGGNVRDVSEFLAYSKIGTLISNNIHFENVTNMNFLMCTTSINSMVDLSSIKPSPENVGRCMFYQLRAHSIIVSTEMVNNNPEEVFKESNAPAYWGNKEFYGGKLGVRNWAQQ